MLFPRSESWSRGEAITNLDTVVRCKPQYHYSTLLRLVLEFTANPLPSSRISKFCINDNPPDGALTPFLDCRHDLNQIGTPNHQSTVQRYLKHLLHLRPCQQLYMTRPSFHSIAQAEQLPPPPLMVSPGHSVVSVHPVCETRPPHGKCDRLPFPKSRCLPRIQAYGLSTIEKKPSSLFRRRNRSS